MPSAAQTALERLSTVERPIRLAFEAVLIAVMALLVARLAWLLISPSDSVANYVDRPLPSPLQGAASSLAISADRTILVRSNPFQQGEVELVVEDAPETNLNLKLDGLRMSSEGGANGNAIIRTPDGIGKNYSVGDEILGGVTLERILSDRVIINRDGATETLMLGGRGAGLSVISDDSQTIPTSSVANAAEPEPTVEVDTGPLTGRIAGPEVLLSAVNAGPVQVNGAITGFRLSPLGNADLMRQAGLEPGDVLLQVNSTSVANLDIDGILEHLSSADSADLTVNRNGSERTIRLEFGE